MLDVKIGEMMGWPEILTIVGANFVLMLTCIGSMIVIFTHLDNKTTNILNSIQQEMKDFHGRLCSIEERRNKKEK